jgi:hypothetical protein
MIQNVCNLRYKDAYTSCYICHAKCKKCTKESYTYATKEHPHTNSRNQTNTKLPPANEWKLLNLGVWWKYRLVGHVWVHGSKLSSLFLRCLSENDTSHLCAWFWSEKLGSLLHLWHCAVTFGTWVYSSPKSLMVYVIQRSWEQHLAAATYSASVVDWAALDCLREDQDTKEELNNWQVLEVDFLSNRHPAKSASRKPWRAKKKTRCIKGWSRECDTNTWKCA